MATYRKQFIHIILFAALLLGGGCVSARVRTALIPDEDPSLQSPAGTFHVADLTLEGTMNTAPQPTHAIKKCCCPWCKKSA